MYMKNAPDQITKFLTTKLLMLICQTVFITRCVYIGELMFGIHCTLFPNSLLSCLHRQAGQR